MNEVGWQYGGLESWVRLSAESSDLVDDRSPGSPGNSLHGSPSRPSRAETRKGIEMTDPRELLHINLHEVFGERDPNARQAAIGRAYAEDARFIDPEGEVVGQQSLNASAQKLLDGAPEAFVFDEDGPQYASGDTAAMPWRFGPPSAESQTPRSTTYASAHTHQRASSTSTSTIATT
jgi:hypothetical protein